MNIDELVDEYVRSCEVILAKSQTIPDAYHYMNPTTLLLYAILQELRRERD